MTDSIVRRRGVPLDIDAQRLPEGPRGGAARPPGSAPAPTSRVVQVYLPELYPIPSAQFFQRIGSADLTGAGATGTPADLELELASSQVGVIRSFTIDANDMSASSDLRVTLLVNGTPMAGFAQIKLFPRVAATVSMDVPNVLIRLPRQAKVSVKLENVAGSPQLLGASYTGWFWDEIVGKAWLGESGQ